MKRGKSKAKGMKGSRTESLSRGPQKKYLKTRPICKVTFRLPSAATEGASRVDLVGDFNQWIPGKTPMKRLKNGDWTVTVDLPSGNQYRYRFLIDNSRWENDWFAEAYQPNPFGSDDSVITV